MPTAATKQSQSPQSDPAQKQHGLTAASSPISLDKSPRVVTINTADYHWDTGSLVVDLRNMSLGQARVTHVGGIDTLLHINNIIGGASNDTIYMGGLGSFIE